MAGGVRDEVGFVAPIEGLRGVAVLWVVAFHYVLVRGAVFPADPWIRLADVAEPVKVVVRNGYLGVDLFFLITGFLLMLPWFRHAHDGAAPSARDFYLRRARRILPAYYVQLLFLFFVCLPLLRDMTYWKTELPHYLYNLGAHVFMLHYTTPVTSASLSLNGALWTLALEAQYYLLLPLLAPLFVRAPLRMAAVLLAAALGWRWLAQHSLGPLVELEMGIGAPWRIPESVIRHLLWTQLPGYLAHFAAGILAGYAWLRWRGRTPGTVESAAWPTATVAALVLLYLIHAPDGITFGDFNWVVIPVTLGIAMLAMVSSGAAFARPLLVNRPLLFTGRVSYSVYLYHLPLLLLWNHFGPREAGWASLPIYLAIVFAVAWLSWRFVEMPNITREKRPASPRASAIPPATPRLSQAPEEQPLPTALR